MHRPDSILELPEIFRTAAQNSRLWKWERSQELETTGCLAKGDAQDRFPHDLVWSQRGIPSHQYLWNGAYYVILDLEIYASNSDVYLSV
ncbi:hypothetical protein PAAG_11849 [Paracoccidioides lutzii Pb01]|uniref:Uncharacterized protein n=1 Tax=Paracoccidioides lutzii (strain ATCC MYA-826 / Pb01) TaxID=502779 RepID=A0A0A2V0P6_PARBA|nr:hypothetical protein PAAG_11849 [Paracoccidioides lutzii Pb01]KGQ01386.1 hypothetical protein PAAG_11849 [Paracoccidioides lutzii Pb01]